MTTTKRGHCWSRSAFGKVRFLGHLCLTKRIRIWSTRPQHSTPQMFTERTFRIAWRRIPLLILDLQCSCLNGFLPSWTVDTCCCKPSLPAKNLSPDSHFNGFFLHGLMQYVFSSCSFQNNCSHKCHIWMAFSLHGPLKHVFSGYPFEKSCSHKCHIWMAFFPHELIQHVFSC